MTKKDKFKASRDFNIGYCFDFETTDSTFYDRFGFSQVCIAVGKKIGSDEKYLYVSIEDFMEFANSGPFKIIYFHNLKFDGKFILYWAVKNNIKFEECINFQGVFFFIKFENVEFRCSLNYLGTQSSIEKLGKLFNIPKLEIDYRRIRPYRSIDEIPADIRDYAFRDVEVQCKAMETFIPYFKNSTSLTIASTAFSRFLMPSMGKGGFHTKYKHQLHDNEAEWSKYLSSSERDIERHSYWGGLVQCRKEYIGQLITSNLYHHDVNSEYPWVMKDFPLPYGAPMTSAPVKSASCCQIRLKITRLRLRDDRMIPWMKNPRKTILNDYIREYYGEPMEIYMWDFEVENLVRDYETDFQVISKRWFKAEYTLRGFIKKWEKVKVDSKISGNSAMEYLAKIIQNSCYGKAAENQIQQCKLVKRDEFNCWGGIAFESDSYTKEFRKDNSYLPLAMYITARGREVIIEGVRCNLDSWVYCDTDSLITIGKPKGLDIDSKKYGCWKNENDEGDEIVKFKSLGAKCYMYETKSGKIKRAMASVNKKAQEAINWDNFTSGLEIKKLSSKCVKGGCILYETTHKFD